MKREYRNLVIAVTVCALMMLITSARAAPTTNNHKLCLTGGSLAPESCNTVEVFESFDTSLAAIGREITLLPTEGVYSPNSQKTGVIALPVIPAAMLLVLTGFVCVSLVRDRRIWLSLFTTLLYTCQGGLNAVPKLAEYLCRGTSVTRRQVTKALNLYPFENNSRTRCDIEGTDYIGLLRHLAGIPETKPTAEHLLYKPDRPDICRQNKHFFQYPQPATESPYFPPITASKRFVSIIQQRLYFRFSIIFSSLSRGPPDFPGYGTTTNEGVLKSRFILCA